MEEKGALEPFEGLINEATLAEWWDCQRSLLRRWREERQGPPFFVVGKSVWYRRIDIESWMERQAAASVEAVTPVMGHEPQGDE